MAELIAQVLEKDGHSVRVVHSAEAALESQPDTFDLILSDVNMPGLTGRDFLVLLKDRWPNAVAMMCFISVDTMSPVAESFLHKSGRPYLEKPVVPADLRKMVDTITNRD
ncbi:MAG: response regulator [Paracoccaceae bacterium]